MPSDMLTSALAIYDSTADKVTFSDFVSPEHCLFYFLSIFKLIINANQELN